MKMLKEDYPLEGFIDTHIHTAPDIKLRKVNDIEAAQYAAKEKMQAIVLKSHVESTVGRAKIAEYASDLDVFGGLCLNESVGGLNPEAVKVTGELNGKMIWLPTISKIKINYEKIEDILHIIAQKDLVLATGHLNIDDIFLVLDMAKSFGIWKLIINHPLTRIIDASLDIQKEMAKYAYLEHCYVACMDKHDNLQPKIIADAIKEIGYRSCIMATDFGQIHNPIPVEGMKSFIGSMRSHGISRKEICVMCLENPYKLIY
jgi:Family of unknown function (DUF6282)